MDMKLFEVLLVEDSDDDILFVQESFKRHKIANPLRVVRDGVEALDYLRKKEAYHDVKMPSLVLLDIKMPRKDGFEVLKEIKGDELLKQIPVVMLTTSMQEVDVVKSYRYGTCSYVQKPVGFESFQKIVNDMMIYWTLVSKVPGTGL